MLFFSAAKGKSEPKSEQSNLGKGKQQHRGGFAAQALLLKLGKRQSTHLSVSRGGTSISRIPITIR